MRQELELEAAVQVFALAAECAMERGRLVQAEEALDLWALAASLQARILLSAVAAALLIKSQHMQLPDNSCNCHAGHL